MICLYKGNSLLTLATSFYALNVIVRNELAVSLQVKRIYRRQYAVYREFAATPVYKVCYTCAVYNELIVCVLCTANTSLVVL